MTVLHLVPSVGPFSGGMGTGTLLMAEAQRSAGLTARIWSTDTPSFSAAAAADDEVIPLRVVGPRRFAWSPAGERRARVTPADIVHQHGLWTAQSRITEIFRRRGVPTVVAPQGSLAPVARRRSAWKKALALRWFESHNLASTSCLQATSDQELQGFRDFGLRTPVAIVPNGVAPTWLSAPAHPERFRRRHGIGDATRVMLFLSRVHPIKGLPMLVEALAKRRDTLRAWRLVIAGPDAGGHRAEVERLAARRGVSDLITFVGAVFGDDKRDAFAAADLFVLPTHSENFGIVVAEALASGVPVITTHGAPWEELEAHRCGWWVAADSRSLGGALVDAATRPTAELRAMGARGRALVISRYLWPTIAEQTITLYRWLLGDAPRPSFVVVG